MGSTSPYSPFISLGNISRTKDVRLETRWWSIIHFFTGSACTQSTFWTGHVLIMMNKWQLSSPLPPPALLVHLPPPSPPPLMSPSFLPFPPLAATFWCLSTSNLTPFHPTLHRRVTTPQVEILSLGVCVCVWEYGFNIPNLSSPSLACCWLKLWKFKDQHYPWNLPTLVRNLSRKPRKNIAVILDNAHRTRLTSYRP